MTTIDQRELIVKHYELMTTDDLEQLKRSIMHSIQVSEQSNVLWHREYTSIRIELATRNLNALEAELPVNTDLLEPEYVAWKGAGE
jgi:hypothetical protein